MALSVFWLGEYPPSLSSEPSLSAEPPIMGKIMQALYVSAVLFASVFGLFAWADVAYSLLGY